MPRRVRCKAASRAEFEIKGDEAIHKPTGARFSADEGRREISHIHWGHRRQRTAERRRLPAA